jgi:hypothetical protein
MKEIGGKGAASHEAWRDVKDYYETIDVWNFFCSVLSGNPPPRGDRVRPP